MKIYIRKGFFLLFIFLLSVIPFNICVGWPNIPAPSEIADKIKDKLPDLDKILEGDPPVTTSLKDAITEISVLDDYEPPSIRFLWMGDLPRNDAGAFRLERPGLFEFTAQSYCLKAGSYSPGKGNGYLYAPLKGPQEDIVRNVLRNSYKHPEIPQRKVQVLLWAIISRTKLTEMSRENQLTASKLLTPEEMYELNGGALGLIPEDKKAEAFKNVPDEIRRVLEAEAALRKKLTSIEAKYDDLEKIAVLTGEPPAGKDSREIPSGRWSYHEDGYFIRFFPSSYTKDKIQISIPDKFTIKKDNKGRIVSIRDDEGNLIEVEYDETTNPLEINTDSYVRGHAFKKVRFVKLLPVPPEIILNLEAEWKNKGWVLQGNPSGKGSPASTSKFPGAEERYIKAVGYKEELEKLDEALNFAGGIKELLDLIHFKTAIEDIIESYPQHNKIWIKNHPDVTSEALQYVIIEKTGRYVWAFADGSEYKHGNIIKSLFSLLKSAFSLPIYAEGGGDKIPWFDPFDNVGTPGNTSRQRIGNSGRGALSDEEKEKACEQLNNEINNEQKVLDGYEDEGLLKAAKDKGYNGYEYNNCLRNLMEKAFESGSFKNFNELSPGEQQEVLKQPDPSASGGSNLENPMGTTSNCRIQENWSLQDYIDKFGEAAGKILQKAHRAHERSHQKTCKEKTDFHEVPPGQGHGWPIDGEGYNDYMEDPDNYSKDEQKAYKAGIAEKKKGLKDLGCE